MDSQEVVRLSAPEERRFGMRTARAEEVTLERLPEVLEFCRTAGARLLIARCRTSETGAAQAMERAGFMIADCLAHYDRDLRKSPIPADTGTVPVRPLRSDREAEEVRSVATEAFRGYLSHYRSDPRLDQTLSDELYASWAYDSCLTRSLRREVLVADSGGGVAGFGVMRFEEPEEAEGALFAVAPEFQRRGIFRSLLVRGLEWSLARDAKRMTYSTQISNTAPQKVLVRLGFELAHSYFTFHKWFD